MKKHILLALTALALSAPTISSAAPVVFRHRRDSADIKESVDAFRDFLGPLNPNAAGSSPAAAGRSTGMASDASAPHNFPPTLQRQSSRGAVFSLSVGLPGERADNNLTNTPILFGNIHPALPLVHHLQSAARSPLWTATSRHALLVPGSATSAMVNGFGAVSLASIAAIARGRVLAPTALYSSANCSVATYGSRGPLVPGRGSTPASASSVRIVSGNRTPENSRS